MWPFSDPTADLRSMLEDIMSRVSQESCDTGLSEFRTRKDAVVRYKDIFDEAQSGSFSAAVKMLRPEFAPTGNLQELAMANGWHQQYMTMAKRFDKLERTS
jgi:hypothetical protein